MIVALIVYPSTFSRTDVLFRPLQVVALGKRELVLVARDNPFEDNAIVLCISYPKS